MLYTLSRRVFSGLRCRWSVPRILWYNTWASILHFGPHTLPGPEESLGGLPARCCPLSSLSAHQPLPSHVSKSSHHSHRQRERRLPGETGNSAGALCILPRKSLWAEQPINWEAELLVLTTLLFLCTQELWASHGGDLGEQFFPSGKKQGLHSCWTFNRTVKTAINYLRKLWIWAVVLLLCKSQM